MGIIKQEYNEQGLPTYIEYSDGSFIKLKYDKNNRIIRQITSEYTETTCYLDDGGKIVQYDYLVQGGFSRNHYDERGNNIHYERSYDGFWRHTTFDTNNHIICVEYSYGVKIMYF
jgi:YD repeat-containing protein